MTFFYDVCKSSVDVLNCFDVRPLKGIQKPVFEIAYKAFVLSFTSLHLMTGILHCRQGSGGNFRLMG